MQIRRYKQLTNVERESISRGLAQNKSIRDIAQWIMRYPSTVAREIRRNRGKASYRAFSASQRAKTAAASRKAGKSKLDKQDRLRRYVIGKLKAEWSPKEISERVRIE